MRYEYNDSQGGRHVRERAVTYDTFTIVGAHGYFHLVFSHEGATVWEQELDVGWEFVGLGKFRLCNSGPYCWFTITK